MHDSHRYRYNAADCLRAARKAREPHYRKLYLLMTMSWVTLARQDEAIDDLLAILGMAKSDGLVLPPPTSPTPSPYHQSTKADRSRQRPLQG